MKLFIKLLVQLFLGFLLHCVAEAYMDSRTFAGLFSFVGSCLIAVVGVGRPVSPALPS